jgi:hypothetical protein
LPPLFIGFPLAVVGIVTPLQYLPALAVGPIRGALPRRPRSDILALVPQGLRAVSPNVPNAEEESSGPRMQLPAHPARSAYGRLLAHTVRPSDQS